MALLLKCRQIVRNRPFRSVSLENHFSVVSSADDGYHHAKAARVR